MDSSKGSRHDLAVAGVMIHIICDAANNFGVIIAALVIWLARYGGRFYADPAVSMGIAVTLFLSSLPLIKDTGLILLQSAPDEVNLDDVKHDLEQIPAVLGVHELHIWRLNQRKCLASAHIVLSDDDQVDFKEIAKTINECFHAYEIHSATLQPEVIGRRLSPETAGPLEEGKVNKTTDKDRARPNLEGVIEQCQIGCGTACVDFYCCQ
ncbi:hypothetical protein MAP00_007933 [Monascus purpureus]|nr:hypothetical protein MAP00_007933 [Monascus purpureus]